MEPALAPSRCGGAALSIISPPPQLLSAWKIIGARYYIKAYKAHYNGLNTTYAFRSPRDHDGHGTHTASTVAGRTVPGASALGGFAAGAASGGVPRRAWPSTRCAGPSRGPTPTS
ncbi:subtilisin-like protease SBT5.3 [Panicum miliaceum]|uniref:Subtilisin-like protease SBT5.3 n=1 Tax=Panicum miliaceum TaxID=4540 RepID=A0A3L6SRA4_PANMI|nr:subtilisin-like protease SBT5.3 [Panicum miliaceum]